MGPFILGLFLSFSGLAQDDMEAKKWLDQASQKMGSYQNVAVDFDYVLDNKAEDVQQKLSGDLLLAGDKYVVNLFGSTQIYDGKRTYTIIPENEEVNISETDIDDSSAFTPSKIYTFYHSGYNYAMDRVRTVNGKKAQFVKLVPIDSDSETASVLVGIEVDNKHICQVIETGKNGTQTILTAKNIKTNQDVNAAAFSFDEKKYEAMNYLINR